MSDTNRMRLRTVSVGSVTPVDLWGDWNSGVLNGGSRATCTVTVPAGASPNDLVATIWVKSTPDSPWVADPNTVTCPHSSSTKIDATEIVGYAAKITGLMNAGGPYGVTASAVVST